ncbi:MAG: metal ABC transporter substrate-binding protein [Planctomycetota bacterium]|jgi:zinc/manganese transport system substrate-binding protein
MRTRNLLVILMLLPLSAGAAAQERLDIVATIPDLAYFVETIGGEQVSVKTLVPAGYDPHSVLPKASLLLKLSRADGLILMGLDYEHAFLPALLEKTRNDAVRPGGRGYMNVGERIEAMEVPESLDRSQGADLHPRGNPHYNLDPENGRIMARAAFDLLVSLDPASQEQFEERWSAWDREAQRRIAKWDAWMEPLRGEALITYHRSWSYFTARYGLEVVAEVEPKPGLAPSAKHLLEVKKILRARQVRVLLMEPWYPEQRVRSLGEDGVAIVKLATTSGSHRDQMAYLDYFESLILVLRTSYGLAKPEPGEPQVPKGNTSAPRPPR